MDKYISLIPYMIWVIEEQRMEATTALNFLKFLMVQTVYQHATLSSG